MLRSERSERLEAWAAGSVLAPTLRDGRAGLLRMRWFLTQLSMKAGARLAVSVVLINSVVGFVWTAGGPKDVEIVDYHR